MKRMKFLLTYLDDVYSDEQVVEIVAYSESQALLLAQDYCKEESILNLECTVRLAAC